MQRAAALLRNVAARLSWSQDFLDVLLAVTLASFVLTIAVVQRVHLDGLGAVLLLGQTMPLAMRRHRPGTVLAICGVAIALYSGFGYQEVGANVGVLIAFYSVAANRPRRDAVVAAAWVAGGVFLTLLNYSGREGGAMNQLFAVYLEYAVAWLVGDYLRVRRAYTRELEERAARLEREREEQAQLAVTMERTRIARELHDVVAHHVSVMVVQAAGARRIADADPAAAAEALLAVESAGRTALMEMRHMLEVLRAEEAGLGPQPSLTELERLVGQVRETGLPLELVVEGKPRALPPGMDVAAYRVIQEALTNAVRHAGKAHAHVAVRYGERTLEIEVADDGRGAAAPLLEGATSGHGLIGMRERVQLYGGTLEAGPRLNGGFRVHAWLPLGPEPADPAQRAAPSSALAAVASAAERDRASGVAAGIVRIAPPEATVAPRVMPPLVGRVVPPRRADTSGES